MRDTWPLLKDIPFPALTRGEFTTLQLNLGYRCNLSCVHCHVAAGPRRTETMSKATMATQSALTPGTGACTRCPT